MEALLVSLSTVFIAEMGDRTQLLSLVLATQYRKPWPIIAGIFVATLANHAAAGFIGVWFGRFLTAAVVDAVVGVSMQPSTDSSVVLPLPDGPISNVNSPGLTEILTPLSA